MKLVTGIITAALFLGAGNHALASIAEPAPPAELQSAGNAIHTTSESTTNNSVSISGTTDRATPATPPVLITGNVIPSSTTLADLTTLTRSLNRGHGGFFFDNAESPTARISISKVSPAASSISVMNVEPLSDDMQSSSTPVPLPPAFLLAASGLAGLIAARRKMLPA